ncbi:predicted protein [Sclerotinia sclerotiorum 1980 UF-70]|uniref:Uncharacterized protein n=1 Tax=Sclerotinia sclerotiorum (strain ATCC 18683 / 1980 / Ss-1) TaxID=665079 RepID=A7F5Y2_SCLS1|nr:predicted protein [Sclerotinia sclerotiorum 1980 UF-70]EDN98153.1 predicted protein [Sclerotinia sclerotiorum 1980 UF-70]
MINYIKCSPTKGFLNRTAPVTIAKLLNFMSGVYLVPMIDRWNIVQSLMLDACSQTDTDSR